MIDFAQFSIMLMLPMIKTLPMDLKLSKDGYFTGLKREQTLYTCFWTIGQFEFSRGENNSVTYILTLTLTLFHIYLPDIFQVDLNAS